VTDVNSYYSHKEEDEGYLAAEAGLSLSANPYPMGTIRYSEWTRGWRIKNDEAEGNRDEGYLAAAAGLSLSQNPHCRGTIRYAEWIRGWRIKSAEDQRARRLGRTHSTA
jgi:ribosome modulation factor